MKKENKIIRDGKVAVALSPGFGSGWVTSNFNNDLSPFEPKVIKMIQAGKSDQINEDWCEKELGINNIYCGGVEDLEVVWIKKGDRFSINNYDGNESLYIASELEYVA